MNKKDKIIIFCLSLILLLVCSCWGFQWWNSQQKLNEYETNVNEITEISFKERQEALNKVVEEGMINIQYSMGATFKGKISESFNVRNAINNHHPLIFELYDPQGSCIYTSKMIEPGYEINKIELEKELPKGVHECSIMIGYANVGNITSVFPITIEVK